MSSALSDPILTVSSHNTLRRAVLDILEQHGPISTGALVQQLQALGHQPLPSIWRLLDALRDEGLVIRSGSLTRQTWDVVRPESSPLPTIAAPELEDPATFLDLPATSATTDPQSPTLTASRAARRRGRPVNAPRTTRYKSLTRCDYPQKHMVGYMVRVRWGGVMRQAFFADHKHGDRLGSLAAALEWRDATERAMGKPHSETPVPGPSIIANTGVPGVTRTMSDGRPILQVTWRDSEGKIRRTSVAIRKYGEAGALRRAKEILRSAQLSRPNASTLR